MAISETALSSALVLKIKTGVDSSGNDVFKSMTLKKVKTTAADQDIFDVAQGIKGILKDTVMDIMKQSVNELVNA